MGDYAGTFTSGDRPPIVAEGKAIAEGLNKSGQTSYRMVFYTVPASHDQKDLHVELTGDFAEGQVKLTGKGVHAKWKGLLGEGHATAAAEGMGTFDLKRLVRHSPTEGKPPPPGAVVLLELKPGKRPAMDAWNNDTWVAEDDGSFHRGQGHQLSKREFGDFELHLEFLCPYEPAEHGTSRGNSGVFIQGKYEIQILDSFGLVPQKTDCGAIYGFAAPKVNACLPPLAWQTYDITFHHTRQGEGESATITPVVTVLQNGTRIHDEQPMRPAQPMPVSGKIPRGPILLQDHGSILKFRNIWVIER